MTYLTRVLFPLADHRRTPWTLLKWWERRRLTYNIFVGSAGLIALALIRLITWLPPHTPFPGGWIGGVLGFAVMANACYSFGWATETFMRLLWGEEAPRVGPALFRQGVAFSIGLPFLGVFIFGMNWVMKALGHLFF